jgi:hypothetical protein
MIKQAEEYNSNAMTSFRQDFCKFLPSAFGRGAGDEGVEKLHKLSKQLFAKNPHPNHLPVGEGAGN